MVVRLGPIHFYPRLQILVVYHLYQVFVRLLHVSETSPRLDVHSG